MKLQNGANILLLQFNNKSPYTVHTVGTRTLLYSDVLKCQNSHKMPNKNFLQLLLLTKILEKGISKVTLRHSPKVLFVNKNKYHAVTLSKCY